MSKLRIVILLCFAFFGIIQGESRNAYAGLAFHTDEVAWAADVHAAAIEPLDTNPMNVALADEIASPPGENQALGQQLTFRPATTGLCESFTLHTLQAGAGMTYDDAEGGPVIFPPGYLSIGDINNFEDDDFRLTFTTGAVYAFGFFLIDNTQESSEGFEVFGRNGLLGTLIGSQIPDSSSNGSTFVGVVASESTHSIFAVDVDLDGDEDVLSGSSRPPFPVH